MTRSTQQQASKATTTPARARRPLIYDPALARRLHVAAHQGYALATCPLCFRNRQPDYVIRPDHSA